LRVSSGYVCIISFVVNVKVAGRKGSYAEPRHGAADRSGDHGCAEGGLVRSQFASCNLLDGLVDRKVEAGAECVAHGVEFESGV
jgi:hypothetical protein